MPRSFTRRTFLASTAAVTLAAGASAAPAGKEKKPRPEAAATSTAAAAKKLNVGIIGVGGRGFNHVQEVNEIPTASVVALCDVDALSLVRAARHIPSAAVFTDYRDLLKHRGLDAVLISTPDHTHAVAIGAALRAGKHVYCEKPLCHTIPETRAVVDLAKETKLVTQNGTQMHAAENHHRVVELIQAGAIGPVREVHIWHERTRRPYSDEIMPVPAQLNYDLWLGPATMRPFRGGYHPYSWRHYRAFGNGQLGDQSSHFLDPVYWALGLEHPVRITATGTEKPSDEKTCNYIEAVFEFAARGDRPAVKLFWYDNPKKPADWSKWKLDPKIKDEATLYIGDGGMLCNNYHQYQLLPEEKFKDFKPPAPSIPKSLGHQRDWVEACLKNDPSAATTPFSAGALLAELAILGNIAFRAGKPLEFDSANLRFPNAPEAEKYLSQPSREGWTI